MKGLQSAGRGVSEAGDEAEGGVWRDCRALQGYGGH